MEPTLEGRALRPGRLHRRALQPAFALSHLHWVPELTLLVLVAMVLAPTMTPVPLAARPARAAGARLAITLRPPTGGSTEVGDLLPIAATIRPKPVARAVAWALLPALGPVLGFGATVNPRLAVPSTGPGHSDLFTLSFDDCGDASQIGALADLLERAHRQALFFITGQCRDRFPWLVGELQRAGHLVCNHSYSHPDLRFLSDAQVRFEIGNGVRAGCPYFRPPFGAWDGPGGRIARIAAEFGLSILMWDVDTRDWAGAEAGPMVQAVQRRGGVVLFHLHGRHTVEAVDLLTR